MTEPTVTEQKISRRKMITMMGASILTVAGGSTLLKNAAAAAEALDPNASDATESLAPGLVEQGESTQATGATAAVSFYNVKDFGAVGDGVADDTNAIQTALTLAASAAGTASMVFIPKGIYRLTQTLRLYARTYLKLDQGTRMVRHHSSSFLINGDWNASYPGYDGQGQIVIEGGVWDGNILQYPDMFNGFGLARARNVIVRDLEVRDIVTAHAIDMNACDDVLIDNCRFLGYRDGTVDQSRNYAEAIQVANHTETGFSDFGSFDGTPSRNIRVTNCYFGASGTAGTQAWPAGVGNHYAVHDIYVSNFVLEGNTFDGMTFAGFRSFKFADVVVANNVFLNCHKGIMLSNPAANTESSKTAAGVQTGLPQSSHNIDIHDNVFNNTTGDAIYCVGWPKSNTVYAKVETLSIHNNMFDTNSVSNSCLTLKWVNNVQVTNNQFRGVYRGVYVAYGTNVIISNNHMSNIRVEGIFIEEPDAAYSGYEHTGNIIVNDNIFKQCGRSAINLRALQHFEVTKNLIEAACTETDNSRSSISLSTGAINGMVSGNSVMMAKSGNKNQYGIQVSGTCSQVQVSNNRLEGKSGRIKIEGATNFEGLYMYSPNGKRYRVTVSDSGMPVYTEG